MNILLDSAYNILQLLYPHSLQGREDTMIQELSVLRACWEQSYFHAEEVVESSGGDNSYHLLW